MMKMKKHSIDDFKSVLLLIKDMIDTKNIRVLFSSEEEIKLTVLSEETIEKFNKETELELDYIYYLIRIDIPRYISSILNDSPSSKYLSSNDTDEEKKEADIKLRLVEDFLIDSKIKNMHLIKSTSKIKTLYSIDWEINRKVFDDSKGKIPELKYATLSLFLNKTNIENNPLAKLFSINDASNNVCINCDLSDIDMLIDMFNDIKEAIETEEGDEE